MKETFLGHIGYTSIMGMQRGDGDDSERRREADCVEEYSKLQRITSNGREDTIYWRAAPFTKFVQKK